MLPLTPRDADAGADRSPSEVAAELVALIDLMEEGVVMFGLDGRLTLANRAACRILGLAPDEITGRTAVDPRWHCVHADGSPWPSEVLPAATTLRTGEASVGVTMGVHRPDGTLRWLRVNTRALRSEETGRVRAVVATFADVTEQRHTAETLAAREAELRLGFDGAPIGICVVDARTGRLERVNRAMGEMLGHPSEHLVGRLRSEFTHPDDNEAMLRTIREAAATDGDDGYVLEHRLIRSDGATVTALAHVTPLRDSARDRVTRLFAQLVDITELRRAEAALRASEERARVLALSLPVGVVELDAAGLCTFANDHLAKITGRSADDVVGWPLLALLHPDDAADAEALIASAVAAGSPVSRQHRVLTPSGAVRWVALHATPLRGPAGEVGPILCCLTDITELRSVTDQLATSEARFRSAFDRSPIGLAVLEPSGRIHNANQTLATSLGRTLDDLVGRLFIEVFHPDDAASALQGFAALYSGGASTVTQRVRCVRPDGTTRHWFATGTAVRGPGGDMEQLFIQVVDETERHLAEEALREREERFRHLALDAPVGIHELDAAGHCLFVNRHWSEITGLWGEESMGDVPFRHIHPEDRDRVRAGLTAARGHRRPWQVRHRMIRPSGEVRHVVSSTMPLIDGDGRVSGFIGTLTDITAVEEAQRALRERDLQYQQLVAQRERERLEGRLAQAQRFEALGRLAGGVAHDFNNLLGVISNYAGFLARQRTLPEALRRDVDQIQLAADKGADLTRRLLLFSRREELKPHRFDLAAAVAALADLLVRALPSRIRLDVDTGEEVHVVADRGQFEQLLLNLVINARDAIAGEGSIRLSVAHARLQPGHPLLDRLLPGDYATLAVTDTGCGMTADVLAQAFEPFFTTKARSEASGLGLATVQGIAEQAGGRVHIDTTPGAGTTVTTVVPLAD